MAQDRFGRAQPETKWDRGLNYRSDFLKTNKGLFGCIYLCAYCGRPMGRKKMQVDHHIAINHVKNNPLYKLYFGLHNIATNLVSRVKCLMTGAKYSRQTGVNVSYNLLPACPKCNNKKSDKGGMWIIRGYIGGTIWKILNGFDQLFRFLWKFPVVKLAVVGLIFFCLLQYYFTGGGIIAWGWGLVKGLFDTVGAGFSAVFSGRILSGFKL